MEHRTYRISTQLFFDTHTHRMILGGDTTFDEVNHEDMLSLTKRDRIIIMTNTTVSGTKTIYSVTTKLLTNRGDRSNPDSTMHTWNHSPSGCTRGTKMETIWRQVLLKYITAHKHSNFSNNNDVSLTQPSGKHHVGLRWMIRYCRIL